MSFFGLPPFFPFARAAADLAADLREPKSAIALESSDRDIYGLPALSQASTASKAGFISPFISSRTAVPISSSLTSRPRSLKRASVFSSYIPSVPPRQLASTKSCNSEKLATVAGMVPAAISSKTSALMRWASSPASGLHPQCWQVSVISRPRGRSQFAQMMEVVFVMPNTVTEPLGYSSGKSRDFYNGWEVFQCPRSSSPMPMGRN